ncbi:hypothetical protein NPIL_566551 [Nephila pilipes]|uniref:Uncharacterized protein n=1 Tax=Nephila pilipes TaxID=299642 RepID=A0A8X6NA13_NEPPI|nr:hypothetical protein NPIL_566551 [Nephila pilipes]
MMKKSMNSNKKERSFVSSQEFWYKRFVWQPNSINAIHPGTSYAIVSCQKNLFALHPTPAVNQVVQYKSSEKDDELLEQYTPNAEDFFRKPDPLVMMMEQNVPDSSPQQYVFKLLDPPIQYVFKLPDPPVTMTMEQKELTETCTETFILFESSPDSNYSY